MRALGSAIDHSGDLDAVFRRTDHRDLGEVGNAGKRDPRKAAFRAGLQGEIAVGLRPAEEAERRRKVFGGETGLLRKSLRRQIVDIAAGRGLADLDEPLLHAALEVGVDEPERDAKLGPETPLRLAAVALDRAEQAEHDAGIVRPLVALRSLEHEDIPRSGTATSFIV